MKRFSKILHKIASISAAVLLCFAASGCSDLSANETEYGNVSIKFNNGAVARALSFKFKNIKLSYKADGDSDYKIAGSWDSGSEIKSVQIPAGSYTLKVTSTVDLSDDELGKSENDVLMADEKSAVVKNNESTEIEFTLKRTNTTVGEVVTKGELNEDGSYTILKWVASDYSFTTEKSNTDISGTFGDVEISGGKGKAGNSYIQLSKNSAGTLKFNVPANTSKIVINAKCGSSGASSCKMTVSGSAYSKDESVGSNYSDFVFEPGFVSENDSDAITVTVSNTDSSSSLNVNSIIVYAPTKWTVSLEDASAPSKNPSENAGIYEETGDISVDMSATTAGSVSGSSVNVKKAEGWLNSAYVIFDDSADSYTITCDGNAVDNELLRHYSTYKYNENSYNDGQTTWEEKSYSNVCRVDVLGLAAGEHKISIAPAGGDATEIIVNVLNHDRSGYAFSGTDTPGAYNKDGTLKSNAKVVYVTKDTAKTVSIDITDSKGVTTKYSGLQNILRNSVLKYSVSDLSLDIRVIGKLSIGDLDAYDSSAEGLSIKSNVNASKNPVPVTIEGVGHDATIWGFGLFARESSHVEISNLGIMCFLDDGISLDTGNDYTWVHNVDIFYGSTGGDSDQAKGDGSLDVKGKSNWQSYSYLHFWDSGKSSLCGMKSETADSRLTYHHNWFDHSDSRHPRIRTQTVHIYNNYFDGNSKYGVGVTMGASAFVEQNIFRNPHDPMMSSKQGTDATGDGTFSGENGGIIKAFNNMYFQLGYNGIKFQHMTNKDKGWKEGDNDIDCYIVDNREDKVPSSVKTVAGDTSYNNFDTSEDLHLAEGSLTEPKTALANVVKFAGRHNPDFAWTFNNAEQDKNYGLIKDLKTAVVNYNNTGLTKIGQ